MTKDFDHQALRIRTVGQPQPELLALSGPPQVSGRSLSLSLSGSLRNKQKFTFINRAKIEQF